MHPPPRPSPRRLLPPTQTPVRAAQQQHARPQVPGSDPREKPRRHLRTDRAAYEILRPYDPRALDGRELATNSGVNLLNDPSKKQLFVEKRLRCDTKDNTRKARNEIRALIQIREYGAPRNIIVLTEHFYHTTEPIVSLVMEHCDASTLEERICTIIRAGRSAMFDEEFIWHTFAGLSKALLFLHTGQDADVPYKPEPENWNTIAHLDIKPGNIFYSTRGQITKYPRMVLGDFGGAVDWHSISTGAAKREDQEQGTPGWFAPENRRPDGTIKGRYGMPTDIWQMGAVAHVMARKIAIPDLELVAQGRAIGSAFSAALQTAAAACLAFEPAERPVATEIALLLRRTFEGVGWRW